jgi:hypothetical protein
LPRRRYGRTLTGATSLRRACAPSSEPADQQVKGESRG